MEPIPETAEAIDEFGLFLDEGELKKRLVEMGDRVQEVVPDCVGLSLASRQHGVTFTLAASSAVIAALDGLQYLDGGPCVAAVEAEQVVTFSGDDVLAEEAWQLFARGTAAASVASTLTLPILVDGRVVGSVNLYASTTDAFTDKHEQVARVVGGWAPGAVVNADLSFATRRTAQEAPRLLHEETRIQLAVGILAANWSISVEAARERLRDAAARAGISETAMAKAVIAQALGPDPSDGRPSGG